MALKKKTQMLGFDTEAYAKIVTVAYSEIGVVDDRKIYDVTVCVRFYTNESKAFVYTDQNFRLQSIFFEDLTFPVFYGVLKTIPELDGYEDA